MILNFINSFLRINIPAIRLFNPGIFLISCIDFFGIVSRPGRSSKKIKSFSCLIITLGIINCIPGWSQQSLELHSGESQQAAEPPLGIMAGQPAGSVNTVEHGLLFHLSGKEGFNAIYAAGGQTLPNYLKNVQITENGPYWHAIEANDSQLLSYWAPGNIYAQRGTLSFFWRSRYPTGSAEFPIFHVKYADHSSRDMDWLRIDYNGYGFDAFVTDSGLSRTRISYYLEEAPKPDEWLHIAISWDETEGIRFYINGMLVDKASVTGMVYDTGLDQFGLHPGITSPLHLQSRHNYNRGGDLADIRIYDRMLSDENIFTLARGERVIGLPEFRRNIINRRWRDAWWNRYGWNLPNEAPPLLTSSGTSVRKVEIHDATDINRWYWNANDGIRETTWPGVCNMSRLPGRYDYFIMPDADCCVESGQAVRFHIPDQEKWNHIEIWGKARGQLTWESDHPFDQALGLTNQQQVKSYFRLKEEKKGGIIRFDNLVITEPIGSFMVYNVIKGKAPANRYNESFTLVPAPVSGSLGDKAMDKVAGFIYGRYPADERTIMTGVSEGETPPEISALTVPNAMPVIHVIIPYTEMQDKGLDGIEIELPEMNVKPTHKEVYPMNLRIKDPLWQMRDMADFSFSVEPDKKYSLWIDTRDRILPEGRALYLTLAGSGPGLLPELLAGAKVKLVYKSKEEALEEHIKDRLTQIKDLHINLMENNMRSSRFNSYNRFYADLQDLLKHDPNNWLAKTYWYYVSQDKTHLPEYEITEAPEGIPDWAHLQVEYLRHLERIIMYYINERQTSNGEFGGGPYVDGVFTNMLTVAAFTGINPDEILESLLQHMTCYYDHKRNNINKPFRQKSSPLFLYGLSTDHADELRTFPAVIQVVSQLLIADYGKPLHINRAMEISRRLIKEITQVNHDGYSLFKSGIYDGERTTKEDPRQWSFPWSYNILHPLYFIAGYNGNPELRQTVIDMADGVLSYADSKDSIYKKTYFVTGDVTETVSGALSGADCIHEAKPLFLAAYHFSGDSTYLNLIPEKSQQTREFNPGILTKLYAEKIKELGVREYINTEGGIHAGRLLLNHNAIQMDRLGGVAINESNSAYPQNFVRWNINKPGNYESLAIFIPKAKENSIDIITYNLEKKTVHAFMTPGDIIPGIWRLRQGLDTSNNQTIDRYYSEKIINLSRGEKVELAFEPREHTIISMELVEPYSTSYWERADLGIGKDDVKTEGHDIVVRIHSLGAIDTPETTVEIRDADGNPLVSERVPSLEAPTDLIPIWTDIRLKVPEGTDISRGSVIVDPYQKIPQILRSNTIVKW